MEKSTVIYQKEEILHSLADSFTKVSQLVGSIDEAQFLHKPGIKWSIAENLDHLIRSTKGLASALKMPKITLRAFGIPNRDSRAFQAIVEKYHSKLQTGGMATGPYVPEKDVPLVADTLLQNWQMIGAKFDKRLSDWTEKQLDQYLLPHPLLGKLTIREMMFFTIYHNGHHLAAMRALLG
ncbi:MAG: DinB family protein [Bacteroidota bacterium]